MFRDRGKAAEFTESARHFGQEAWLKQPEWIYDVYVKVVQHHARRCFCIAPLWFEHDGSGAVLLTEQCHQRFGPSYPGPWLIPNSVSKGLRSGGVETKGLEI